MARYIRYRSNGGARYAEIQGDQVCPLDGEFGSLRPSRDTSLHLQEVELLAPTEPRKIVAVGPNYHAHLGGHPPPPRPNYWIKPSSTVLSPLGTIELPSGVPMVVHESELAIVVGQKAKDVPADQARDYIFGYTCINDVTAGKLTHIEEHVQSQYFVDGKIFDTFGPFGPHIETDLNTDNLHVQCRVNGQVRQDHYTNDMIWSPHVLLARISSVLTLFPGDIIATGSPPGMGPLVDGDVVEVEVEGIGILRNIVRNKNVAQLAQ